MQMHPGRQILRAGARWWPGAAAWAVAWALMVLLDRHVDLANQALLLVLAAAVAAIWWGPTLSACSIPPAVLAFNFAFVPPRGTLAVDLHHHGLLLVAMVSVSWIVTALMARLRRLAAEAEAGARRSDELRRLGDALRESEDPLDGQALLRSMLSQLGGREAALLVTHGEADAHALPAGEHWFGDAGDAERGRLRRCARDSLGSDTDADGGPAAWTLPLRGRRHTHGAALVRLDPGSAAGRAERSHAQALCDQLGQALERAAAERHAARAHEQARLQSMRNTLLSAVAHDHRTPLATIISAAGALHDQADRLDAARRSRLAATILDEATQLARITDNTLQLARLDAVGLDLARDWESPEELIGSVAQRLRQRDPDQRLRVRVEPGLPLLRCNAVLIVQLIDNLVDNAMQHGGGGPVELQARAERSRVVIAVSDSGPGVPPDLLPRLFEPFSRGPAGDVPQGARRGTGVGLALCRAIARVHGGELTLQTRAGGGAVFACSLPVEPAPEMPAGEAPWEDRP
jgi:two-component system sensor histidine kinase KdpD